MPETIRRAICRILFMCRKTLTGCCVRILHRCRRGCWKTQPLPVRVICPGRVYRNETISARAHCFFHQCEGLYVDKDVSFADLKQTLYYFVTEMFGADTKLRFRPSYFPFTEPSAEMDISCTVCGGSGCNLCKHTGWVEILGCGMVHPNMLRNFGIDPDDIQRLRFRNGRGAHHADQISRQRPAALFSKRHSFLTAV